MPCALSPAASVSNKAAKSKSPSAVAPTTLSLNSPSNLYKPPAMLIVCSLPSTSRYLIFTQITGSLLPSLFSSALLLIPVASKVSFNAKPSASAKSKPVWFANRPTAVVNSLRTAVIKFPSSLSASPNIGILPN